MIKSKISLLSNLIQDETWQAYKTGLGDLRRCLKDDELKILLF